MVVAAADSSYSLGVLLLEECRLPLDPCLLPLSPETPRAGSEQPPSDRDGYDAEDDAEDGRVHTTVSSAVRRLKRRRSALVASQSGFRARGSERQP